MAGSSERRSRAILAVQLGVAACAVPLIGWLFWAVTLRLGPNDFHDYWLAGRLLLEGKSPYDTAAMAALAAREQLSFSLGGGYSYPLPFALAMVPFATLPFEVAVVAFDAVSLAAYGATVAAWLLAHHTPAGRPRLLAAAILAGAFPPVYGSLAMGQANLILLPLVAAGAWLASRPHAEAGGSASGSAGPWGGMLLGIATIVKLVPGALIAPLILARRWSASVSLVAAALAAMVVAAILAPWALAGSAGLTSNLDPDAFYTNQSINGFVSRLVTDTPKSMAIVPAAFDPAPVMVVLTALLGLATLAVLWRGRRKLDSRAGLAAGLAFALTAATIGAPKTSFWNESFLLVTVALVVAVEAPDLRLGCIPRGDRAAIAIWFGSALVWAAIWAVEPSPPGPLSAVVNLAWSASLIGMLALWLMFAGRLWRPRLQPAGSTIS